MKGNPKLLLFILAFFCSCDLTVNNSDQKAETDRQILFISDRESYRPQIFLMNSDGSNQRKITNDSIHYGYASFSPDGLKIITNSKTWNDSDDIYIMDISGENRKQLTNAYGDDNLPAFSPDGSKIVFTSYRDGNREIYLMNSDGSNQTRLTNNNVTDYAPRFTKDGVNIIYLAIDEASNECLISLINLSDYSTRVVNDHPYKVLSNFIHENSMTQYALGPSISPDGAMLTFASYNNAIMDYVIKMMSFDGKISRVIAAEEGTNINPVFTPEGNKIIYVSHRYGQFDLYETTLTGESESALTRQNLGHAYFADFSPDKTKILVMGDPVSMNYHIFTMDRDGSNVLQLTYGDNNNYCASYQRLNTE